MKLCKDCAFYKENHMYLPLKEWTRCYHEKAVEYIDLVDVVVRRTSCANMRGYGGKCGPDPKLYQPHPPKRTLLQKLFNLRQHTKK